MLKWFLFTNSLIYLAQMYFSVFFSCLYTSLCPHDSVHACVWMQLISLATQLEGTLSHAQHNAEETADWLPVAILLYARMIWIQSHATVKDACRRCYGRGRCVVKLVANSRLPFLLSVWMTSVCFLLGVSVFMCANRCVSLHRGSWFSSLWSAVTSSWLQI